MPVLAIKTTSGGLVLAKGSSARFRVQKTRCSAGCGMGGAVHQPHNANKHALRCALEGAGAGTGVVLLVDDVSPEQKHSARISTTSCGRSKRSNIQGHSFTVPNALIQAHSASRRPDGSKSNAQSTQVGSFE